MSEPMFGVMLDCSRNGVLRVESVKNYAQWLSRMGYNTLMLYTEDTYEIPEEPYFGHHRGRYSCDELREINDYCVSLGIELIPCIQTLAHLGALFHWQPFWPQVDCDDILLIDDEKTYQLIDRMFASLASCVTSRRIHIGMDEAYRVGRGRYQDEHGAVDRFDLINRHLHRVCDIAAQYGFRPMMWSDMFCKLAQNSNDYYGEVNAEAVRAKAALPEQVSLVYWDYYHKEYADYEKQIRLNQLFDRPVVFAGGAWTWKGFAPDNRFSMDTTEPALRACNDYGVRDILITVWGDDGNECSRLAVLPALYYTAALHRGETDMAAIKAGFKELTGAEFDDFLLLDQLDTPGGKHEYNPSKYLLYNDFFMGQNDAKVNEGDNAYYAALAERLAAAAVPAEFVGMFETLTALARVLAVKAELGARTRAAYAAGDRAALRALAENEYTAFIERLGAFYTVFRSMWCAENKPHGFDVQDIRLGGLERRARDCRDRLLAYAAGEADADIPELDEPVLDGYQSGSWISHISACIGL